MFKSVAENPSSSFFGQGKISVSSFTDGKLGIGITADSNRWSVILGNRAGHSIIAGFKAIAITN